jgi:multidrug resistance efflux pump
MSGIATLILALGMQEPAPAPPASEEVRKGNLVPAFEFEAVIDAAQRFELKLQFEAYSGELVVRSAAAHGAAVRKGDPLLVLEPGALQRQLEVQAGELLLARAQWTKAEAEQALGARADALALAHAERGLADAEGELKLFDDVEGKHLIANADLAVRQNQDVVDDQQEELGQLEKMYKSEELTNATAEIVVRRARRGLERSRVFLEMARAEAAVVRTVRHPQFRQRKSDAVDSSRASLESLKAAQAVSKVQREVEVVRARAAAQTAEESHERLRRDLERLRVAAPFDGRVFHGQFQQGAWSTVEQVSPFLRPGERPSAGQVLLTLCGPVDVALADVPEAELADIVPGLAAEIAPASAPERPAAGSVASLSPHSAPRGSGPAFQARIPLAAPRADLLPGMHAKASLKGAELKDVVVVPTKALTRADGKATVEVVKDGKTETREVKAGRSDGKHTHVRSGLEPGERVAVPK